MFIEILMILRLGGWYVWVLMWKFCLICETEWSREKIQKQNSKKIPSFRPLIVVCSKLIFPAYGYLCDRVRIESAILKLLKIKKTIVQKWPLLLDRYWPITIPAVLFSNEDKFHNFIKVKCISLKLRDIWFSSSSLTFNIFRSIGQFLQK